MAFPGNPGLATVGSQAGQIWAGVANGPQVFIANTDPANDVYLGYDSSIAVGGTNTVDVPALGTVSMDGSRTIYAVAPDGTNPLQVVPGGANWTASPLLIADSIALGQTGLALAIAQAIAAQGISLIGAPVPLYGGNQPARTSGTPGRVGATLDKFTYVPNTSTDLAQYPVFDGFAGRQFNTVRRIYPGSEGNNNITSTVSTDAAAGFKVACTWKPFRDATNNYSGRIPGQGTLTYAQHLADLKTQVAAAQAAATNGIVGSLWHEMNGNGPNGPFGTGGPYTGVTNVTQAEANYAAYVNFYAPAFKLLTNGALTGNMALAFVPAAFSPANMVGFFPTPNVYFTEIDVDYYGQDFNSKPSTVPPAVNDLEALADSLSLPFGIWELGWSNGSANPGTAALTWATLTTFITQEITGRWLPRLQAGKTNADIIWFAAPAAAQPGNSKNTIDATTDATALAAVQAMFDSLSATPATVVSVPASSSVVLAPLQPSPGAGYAPATGISYDVTVTLVSQGVPTNPFCQVRLDWFNVDAAAAQAVDTQIWRLPIAASGGSSTITFGKGPQRGKYLQVTLTNLDTVACSANVLLNSASRPAARDDWRWDAPSSAGVPGFNMANGGPYGNSLGSVSSLSINGSSQKKYLFGMYAGPVYVRFSTGAPTAVGQFIINPQPSSDWGAGALANVTISNNADFEQLMNLPRGPVTVTMINNDTVSRQFSVELVISDE